MEVMKDLKENKFSPMYIFYGEEKYLIEYVLKLFKEKIVDSTYADFNYIFLDGGDVSIDDVIGSLETLPLFSEKKIVVINDCCYFQKSKSGISAYDEEKLINYFKNPSENTIAIFISNGNSDKRKKLYKEFSKTGKSIYFGKFSDIEFFKWISKKFKVAEKEIDKNTIMHLIENVGYLGKNSTVNLFDVDGEICKLISYCSNKDVIKIRDVDSIIKKSFESNIFELLDEIGNKNSAKAMKITHTLLESGEAELKIIAMISRQFRIIYKTKVFDEEGYTASTTATKLGIPSFVARKNGAIAKRMDYRQIGESIGECIKYERYIKTGVMSADVALETLILSISKNK